MVTAYGTLALGVLIVSARASSLVDYCTVEYAASVLPVQDLGLGINIDPSSVSAALATNRSVSSEWFESSVVDYCNITFAYSHGGIPNDIVHVSYLVPPPDKFANRYVSTGGGGLAINSGGSLSPTGIIAGGVSGITDAGFGNFNTRFDEVFLLAKGVVNWQATYMFGYLAHHELATLGKQFTRNFFNVSDTGGVIEKDIGYFPPPCELQKIVNLTIAACDSMDGKVDGVIARSDLCKLNFDYNSTVGQPYYCPASSGRFPGASPTPEQNGTITTKGAAVVSAYTDGLVDSAGKRIYVNPQPGSALADVTNQYNEDKDLWEPNLGGFGGQWITRFLDLTEKDVLDNLENVTADTLRDWMAAGMQKYYDSLQTTWPDLRSFKSAGGKVILVHGEADEAIPAASSVHYYEAVRNIMYVGLGYDESIAAMDEFYRLYLVPGGSHCGRNIYQPASGWPSNTLQTVIEWAEKGIAPDMLDNVGDLNPICKWPLRPLWTDNGTSFNCVNDVKSTDSWIHIFDSFLYPIY